MNLDGYAALLTFNYAAQAVKSGDREALESALPRLLPSDRKVIEKRMDSSANRNNQLKEKA